MILVGEVSGEEQRAPPGLLDPEGGLLGVGLLFGEIGDGDIGALTRERDRDRPPDAGVAAGDERALADESSRALVGLLAVIGLGIHGRREAGLLLLLLGKSAVVVVHESTLGRGFGGF